MRKLFIFLIIFISFGNFMSRSQMSDRYFFLDSYKPGNKGSWAYYNRMIGYNALTVNVNNYLTTNGNFYFPIIYSNNFNYGLYEISVILKYPLSKNLFTGLKIRLMNFFNGPNKLPPIDWYMASGITFTHSTFHITFELGSLHSFHSEEIFPVILSALKTKVYSRISYWMEFRHFSDDISEEELKFIDFNTGISVSLNSRTKLDMGLAFENDISYNVLKLMKLNRGIIYPLIGLQWQLGGKTTKIDETKPFFD